MNLISRLIAGKEFRKPQNSSNGYQYSRPSNYSDRFQPPPQSESQKKSFFQNTLSKLFGNSSENKEVPTRSELRKKLGSNRKESQSSTKPKPKKAGNNIVFAASDISEIELSPYRPGFYRTERKRFSYSQYEPPAKSAGSVASEPIIPSYLRSKQYNYRGNMAAKPSFHVSTKGSSSCKISLADPSSKIPENYSQNIRPTSLAIPQNSYSRNHSSTSSLSPSQAPRRIPLVLNRQLNRDRPKPFHGPLPPSMQRSSLSFGSEDLPTTSTYYNSNETVNKYFPTHATGPAAFDTEQHPAYMNPKEFFKRNNGYLAQKNELQQEILNEGYPRTHASSGNLSHRSFTSNTLSSSDSPHVPVKHSSITNLKLSSPNVAPKSPYTPTMYREPNKQPPQKPPRADRNSHPGRSPSDKYLPTRAKSFLKHSPPANDEFVEKQMSSSNIELSCVKDAKSNELTQKFVEMKQRVEDISKNDAVTLAETEQFSPLQCPVPEKKEHQHLLADRLAMLTNDDYCGRPPFQQTSSNSISASLTSSKSKESILNDVPSFNRSTGEVTGRINSSEIDESFASEITESGVKGGSYERNFQKMEAYLKNLDESTENYLRLGFSSHSKKCQTPRKVKSATSLRQKSASPSEFSSQEMKLKSLWKDNSCRPVTPPSMRSQRRHRKSIDRPKSLPEIWQNDSNKTAIYYL